MWGKGGGEKRALAQNTGATAAREEALFLGISGH